jgi:hypothetical protein
LIGGGCAAPVPYHYGHSLPVGKQGSTVATAGPLVEYGQPNKTLDRLAYIVGLPRRVVGLNKKINNHRVSPQTLDALRTYLDENDLADVTVFVNYYNPKDQWRRLKENQRIGAGWRYSIGSLSVLSYTLLPARVFGGDRYNPYTNSLEVNSDVPAIALYEAAFAKDIHARKSPGTYAALTDLPGVVLFRRSHEVGDVIGYARVQSDWETERQAYHVLYPQVGAETASLAGSMLPVWWAMPALGLGGAAAGHVTGRIMAARRSAEVDAAPLVSTPTDQKTSPGDGEIRLTGAEAPAADERVD